MAGGGALLGYIIRRLLWGVLTLWLTVTLTFFALGITFRLASGSSLLEVLRGQVPSVGPSQGGPAYELQGSPLRQYAAFLWGTVRLDWGDSVSQGAPVRQVLLERFPVTGKIGLISFALAVMLGVPLGIYAAVRGGVVDFAISWTSAFVYSFPSPVLMTLLLALSVYTIGIFPVGMAGADWRGYLLPCLVLGLGAGGYIARITRASVADELHRDYVRTARAKGLRKLLIYRRHVLRNALGPVLAALGPTLGLLLAGSFPVEYAYEIYGTGRLLLDGFAQQDFPLILGGVTLYTVLVLGSNLLGEVVASLIDPRLRAGG